MLTLLALMSLEGISQNYKYTDSVTSIPNSKLRKAINLIEKGKVAQEELDLCVENSVYLQKRIDYKDSIILKYYLKELNWKKLDSSYQLQVFNYKQVIENQEKMCKIYATKLHRQKLKNLFMLISVVGVGAILSNK